MLWDFDNTLAFRPGLWSQCLADVANARFALGLTREELAPHLSKGFPWHSPELEHRHLSDPDAWWSALGVVLASALESSGRVGAVHAAEIAADVRTEYTNPHRWVVFPDVAPALEGLSRAGWRHIVLSNHVPELPALVQALGLAHHFEHILTSAVLGYEKPNPLAFEAALDRVPGADRVIMIGDSYVADYQGARAAGLEAILVRDVHPDCQRAMPDLRALIEYVARSENPADRVKSS